MSFRLMTYNILDGGVNREQLLLEVLKAAETDVVLLQEVMHFGTVQSIATELNMHCFFAKGNSKRQLALLSKFPIVSSYSYHPFPLRNTLLEVTIQHPFRHIHLFGVHLQAHYSILAERWRMWEIKTILQRIEKYHSDSCIIAGDFNAVAPGDWVNIVAMPSHLKVMLLLQGRHIFRNTIAKIILAKFVDCYRILHTYDDGFTLPTPIPHVRLDYVFTNHSLVPHISNCDVMTEPSVVQSASDHYPVVVEFKF